MDDTQDAGGADSPRLKSRHPSVEPDSTAKGSIEHPDSPIRKKPRLGNRETPDTTMASDSPQINSSHNDVRGSSQTTDDNAPRTPDRPMSSNLPPTPTPSRVTLNLKSSQPQSSTVPSLNPEPVSDSVRRSESPSAAFTHISAPDDLLVEKRLEESPLSSASSPVIEIEADEPEDIDSEAVDPVIEMEDAVSLELSFIECFPLCRERILGSESARILGSCMERIDLTVFFLQEIQKWLQQWVQLMEQGQHRHVQSSAYFEFSHFWEAIGSLFARFLRRKAEIAGLQNVRPLEGCNIMVGLFRPYLRVCHHLTQLDCQALKEILVANEMATKIHLSSQTHLQNLDLIFRSNRDHQSILGHTNAALFNMLQKTYGIGIGRLQNDLCQFYFHDRGEYLAVLSRFASLLSESVYMYHDARDSLLMSVGTIAGLGYVLEAYSEDPDEPSEELKRQRRTYIKHALPVVALVEKYLEQHVAKQPAQFSTEWNREMIRLSASIVRDASSLQHETGLDIFGKRIGHANDLDPNYVSIIVGTVFEFECLWKLILKGRLELRVLGVRAMGERLVELYKIFNSAGSDSNHPVLQQMSTFLLEKKVLDHIFSVDSHPQVISRTGLIVGFLHVTRRYPSHLTATVWDLISASSDPRIIAAVLSMLSDSVSHMVSADLALFCGKLAELPSQSFNVNMMQFFDRFIEVIMGSPPNLAPLSALEDIMVPMKLCLRLSREASNRETPFESVNLVHDVALKWLKALSQRYPHPDLRHSLYVDCIQDIKDQTANATGSIEVIRSLMVAHSQTDVQVLVQGLMLPTVLGEDICGYVNRERLSSKHLHEATGLLPRLELFRDLAIVGSFDLSADLEYDVWEHIVGRSSIDFDARDLAWDFLCVILQQFQQSHPFIERCINHYLPKLEPSFFSLHIANFLHAAAEYSARVIGSDFPVEGNVVVLPTADATWRIVLKTSFGPIVDAAIKVLCIQYLDNPLIKRASNSCIEGTHSALIERCIQQLQAAATKLKLPSSGEERAGDAESMRLGESEREVFNEELLFTHTLQFLRTFLVEVKKRPNFNSPHPSTASSSPDMASNTSCIAFVLQAFDGAVQKKVQNFNIGKFNTFLELHEKLLVVTGFSKISVIVGGQRIDLTGNPTESVATLEGKGNMLVKNAGDPKPTSPSTMLRSLPSVAEKEIVRHVDDLFTLLDLDDRWSGAVYDILLYLPAHSHIRDVVVSPNTSFTELFPAGRDFKCLYSLRSMKLHLQNQLQGGNIDSTFVCRGVQLLTAFLESPQIGNLLNKERRDIELVRTTIEVLEDFLRERLQSPPHLTYFSTPSTFVDRIYLIFHKARLSTESEIMSVLIMKTYSVIIEASMHNAEIWTEFIARPEAEPLHSWLILGHDNADVRHHIQMTIVVICQDIPVTTAVQSQSFAVYFWPVLRRLVPQSLDRPLSSGQVFIAATSVLRANISLHQDETELRSYLDVWHSLLIKTSLTRSMSHQARDIVLLGLTRLMFSCLQVLKSLKKPICASELMESIFRNILFPVCSKLESYIEISTELAETVLDTDLRKALYNLVGALCEDSASHMKLVQLMADLTSSLKASDENVGWAYDRMSWMRSNAGYLGLKNLSNTCYINSLVAQLYMNADFRVFMLQSKVTEPTGSQRLLTETQRLFSYLSESTDKFADTGDFVSSIKPYDTDNIDVSIQMDVDEFYNLLFDRWESQMLTLEAKFQFRKFFGGQLVTQIKSMECKHISERLEPFLAIQCEVKGKASLGESLKAYVEGDVMEGDNKYKCESCGGKFVNAVKRSCLKEVPNNLIFHLKRFDFDIQTLQRMKINDRFDFPRSIDMAKYNVDHLSSTEQCTGEDNFELTGVLIHTGTAEIGHYYSLIRIPSSDSAGPETWAEFNDKDVTIFDPSKIPDMSFGGTEMSSNGGNIKHTKFWNAYMLFYQRASPALNDNPSDVGSNTTDAPRIANQADENIQKDNERRAFRFCLFDPSCAQFGRMLLTRMKELQSGICSEGHGTEKETLSMFLAYLEQVIIRVKEFPNYIEAIEAVQKFVTSCTKCSDLFTSWILQNPVAARNMLLLCPFSKIRGTFVDLLLNVLKTIRSRDPEMYGINVNDIDLATFDFWNARGVLPEILKFLKEQSEHLGYAVHSWDNYFELIHQILLFGLPELAMLLSHGFFLMALELLLLDYSEDARTNHKQTWDLMRRSSRKNFSFNELSSLIVEFLRNCNIFGKLASDSFHRMAAFEPEQGVPITAREQHLTLLWDNNEPSLRLVSKVIESWDDDRNGNRTPLDLVERLIKAQIDDKTLRRLARNLHHAIQDFLPTYTSVYLKAALTFCENCPREEDAILVISGVARSASDLENVGERQIPPYFRFWKLCLDLETDWIFPQGGFEHLETLASLCHMSKPAWSDCVTSSYKRAVIQESPNWGTSLLLYDGEDEGQVRRDAATLLNDLILGHFPIIPNSVTIPGAIVFSRTIAVRQLFNMCFDRITNGLQAGVARNALFEIIRICQQCASWSQSLLDKDSDAYARLKTKDDSMIVAKWLSLENGINSLPESDDRLAEETDMEDSDIDSDELAMG